MNIYFINLISFIANNIIKYKFKYKFKFKYKLFYFFILEFNIIYKNDMLFIFY